MRGLRGRETGHCRRPAGVDDIAAHRVHVQRGAQDVRGPFALMIRSPLSSSGTEMRRDRAGGSNRELSDRPLPVSRLDTALPVIPRASGTRVMFRSSRRRLTASPVIWLIIMPSR